MIAPATNLIFTSEHFTVKRKILKCVDIKCVNIKISFPIYLYDLEHGQISRKIEKLNS